MSTKPTLDETTLIRQAQTREPAAFRALAERYWPRLLAGAQSLCRHGQTAEDLAQETLLEAWRSLDRFDFRCALSSWLFGILRHRYLKARRRAAGGEILSLTMTTADGVETPVAAAARTPSPSAAAAAAEDRARLRAAVAQLSEEHRQVIELRFFAGASLEEIALAQGCPLGTVKSRLHHGLEKLRKMSLPVNQGAD